MLFVYTQPARDRWPGWLGEHEYRTQLLSRGYDSHDRPALWRTYESLRDHACRAAERLGWGGEMIDGPYVAALPPLPDCDGPALLVAWRDRDGTTFIASPVALPWLGVPIEEQD